MTAAGTADAIVVGGGVIGCAAAYYLAREGLSVTLLERGDLASQASGAAAGMLAPICESSGQGPFFELGRRSLELFPELVPALLELGGVDPQYAASGVLRVARGAREAEELAGRAARLEAFDVRWLDAREARARVPGLPSDCAGALWSPREGHVYSPLMARAYARAAAALGARIEAGSPAVGLLRQGGRIRGVVTPEGERPAGHVVLCAGAWTRFCMEWLDLRLPLEPVRGQILALEAPQPPPGCIVWDDRVYLVPKRDGSVVVGATEERVGFDCRTTAGGVASLLAAAASLLPSLAECAFRRAWAGLRPDTPDHLPAIGPVPGTEGLSVAAGHFRNGVLLSPVTGTLIAGWITRRELPGFARPFLPARLVWAGEGGGE